MEVIQTHSNNLKRNKLRKFSLPSDWLWNGCDVTIAKQETITDKLGLFTCNTLIEHEFSDFVNPKYLTYSRKFKDTYPNSILNKKYPYFSFFHHDPIKNASHREALRRRCQRFIDPLESDNKLLFIYIWCLSKINSLNKNEQFIERIKSFNNIMKKKYSTLTYNFLVMVLENEKHDTPTSYLDSFINKLEKIEEVIIRKTLYQNNYENTSHSRRIIEMLVNFFQNINFF